MSAHLVLAHGFTQTARSWDVLASSLQARGLDDVTAVDLPGHGAAADIRCGLWGAADHLAEHGGHGVYVGYSMGGRVSLHAALTHAALVERLVLIGATAGIDDDAERTERRAADDALADRIEQIGVDSFIDEWLANPLFAGLTTVTAGRSDRMRNTAAGLASSLRLAGTGQQTPLWDRLAEVTCPVLLLVGQHDAKFTAIAQQMASRLANAQVEIVPDAGHSVHLERPGATADAIAAWLA